MADTDTLAPPIAKPDKPPVKETPKSEAPPIDYDRVSQSLGLGPMQRTLAEDRAKVDALAPGPPRLTPPPTVPPPTDPFQAFGQPAMWLATFGSLLTRHHLTSAIQSAGAVLDSVHKQDDEAVKRAMAEWKINSENAQKMAAYELNAYRAALSHQSNDIREAQAKITTLNHAFQNAVYTEAFNKGGISEVAKLVKKGSADEVLLQERRLKLDADLEKRAAEGTLRKTWKAANPNATQQQIASADLMISQGKDPTELMTKDFTPAQELEVTGEDGKKEKLLAQQDRRTGGWVTADENRTPIHAQSGTFHIVKETAQKPVVPETTDAMESWKKTNPEAAANPVTLNAAMHTIQSGGVPNEQGLPVAKPTAVKDPSVGSPAAIQKNVEDDLKELHPDWSKGRIGIEAKAQIAAGTTHATTEARLKAQSEKPPLTEAAAKMDAELWLLTGAMPGGGRYGQAAIVQIQNEASKLVEGTGHTVADYLAKRAEYKADTASLRALTIRTDALDAAAKATKREFHDVVIPNIPKSPEPLDMQLLTRWVRSGETQFGDTEVPVYMAALISGLDEYAKVLAGATGAAGSTDASRAQAVSVIPPGATTDQIKAIVERVIYPTIDIKIGTYGTQKQQIVDRMSGKTPSEKPETTTTTAPSERPAWVPEGARKEKGTDRWLIQQNGSWHVINPPGGQ